MKWTIKHEGKNAFTFSLLFPFSSVSWLKSEIHSSHPWQGGGFRLMSLVSMQLPECQQGCRWPLSYVFLICKHFSGNKRVGWAPPHSQASHSRGGRRSVQGQIKWKTIFNSSVGQGQDLNQYSMCLVYSPKHAFEGLYLLKGGLIKVTNILNSVDKRVKSKETSTNIS